MTENILKLQEIMHHCEQNNLNALIVSFDFEKAFDTLEHETIFAALELFNFGPKYIQMVKTLFKNPIAYAYNNGRWSDPIYPTRAADRGATTPP